MKTTATLLLSFLLLITIEGYSQNEPVRLLQNYSSLPTSLNPFVKKGSIAIFNKSISATVLLDKPNSLELSFEFENKTWILELEKNDTYSKGFHVISASSPAVPAPLESQAIHYKGKIKGNNKSVVAVSILPDRMVAVLADGNLGNINIAALNDKQSASTGQHIIYRDIDLLVANEFVCATPDDPNLKNAIVKSTDLATNAETVNSEPIDLYFEADYATYQNNGSNITNVVNYVTALFNVVNVLYQNDSINVRLNAIKVWDLPDPYIALGTTSTVLDAFANNMSAGFPGDFAHFLSQRGLGGGIAYVNTPCSNNYFKTAVSGNLSNSFNLFPTYSWSVEVITHELGHNFGSNHTQSCSWPGGAIDNCYTTEGGCPPGPAPTNGGTIMSYCHLTSYGINFSNGFGPLPGARIRSVMRNNTCINPSVYFETTSVTVREDSANTANNCLPYKLITTKLSIPYAPSQPAGITLALSGSASLQIGANKDVEITPLNFVLDGANLSQTISIKVYNDALVENNENAIINFTVNSNGGNALKKSSSNQFVATIQSEDNAPDQVPNKLIFQEDFESISSGLGPWTQSVIFGASSPNRWVIGNNGSADFPSKGAFISNNGTNAAYSGSSVGDSSVVRLISPIINATSYSGLLLTAGYSCNGEVTSGGVGGGQGAVYQDFGRVYYSIDGGNIWTLLQDNLAFAVRKSLLSVTLPPAVSNQPQLRLAFEWRNNSSVVNNPPLIIDSIVLKGSGAAVVQTESHPNNSTQENLGPLQTVHFYNKATGNIIASVQNNSNFDFGCTSLELLRTGTGSAQAWGQFTDQQISSKLVRIVPTNVNSNASYTVKLYLTAAEINGWLGATGNKITDLTLAKSTQDISVTNPLAIPVFSSNTIISPFGNNDDRQISADFTGFGYFAISKSYFVPACLNGVNSFSAGITGTAYQWQVNTGSGYVNLTNNSMYSGVNTATLQITNAPSTQYGYKYRCNVTTALGNVFSTENVLRFESTWLGTVSNAWENPLNWSCGQLPDLNTDVIVNGGTPFALELNSSVNIRSLRIPSSANIKINTGNTLTIRK